MTGPVQIPLDLGHRPAMGGDDFLVAPSNAEAVAWLDRWPAWPAPALTLFGPAGCGKSHLASVWRARSGAPLLSAAELPDADLPALAAGRAVVVDNADKVAGRKGREEALFHLYNRLRDADGHLLLLAHQPPARWRVKLADLRSRLNAAPAVAVEPPDDALLAAVLVKLFADRQVMPGEEVVDYLVARIERSLDAARRVVAAIDHVSLVEQRRITVPLARSVLLNLDGEGPDSEGEEGDA